MKQKTLVSIVGPTGVGKTKLTLTLANHFNTDIISSDSRQIYRNLDIGTAKATKEEQAEAKHHFLDMLDVAEHYSAARFESDVLALLPSLFENSDIVLMAGGSMLYVDAIWKGIDDMPDVNPEVRKNIVEQYQREGLETIGMQLQMLDPAHYERVDLNNPKRVMHALEVCISTGKPYSSFLTNTTKKRPFNIITLGLTRDREELYQRINLRVDQMVNDGLIEEAKAFYPYKTAPGLQTVGYKELFGHFDGLYSLEEGIALIKRNTRRYAKKQLTWFKKKEDTLWIHPNETDKAIEFIQQNKT